MVLSPEISEETASKLADLANTPSREKRFGLDIIESHFLQRGINRNTPKFEVHMDLLRMMCRFPEAEEQQIRCMLTWVTEMYIQLDQEMRNKLAQQTGGRLTYALDAARDNSDLNKDYMPLYWSEVSTEFKGLAVLLGMISTSSTTIASFEPAVEASVDSVPEHLLRMAS